MEIAVKNKNDIWIIGCGDIGRRVARLYLNDKLAERHPPSIYGIVSSSTSADQCKQLSIYAHVTDLDSDFTLDNTDFSNTNIFYFAPPPPTGEIDTRLKRFLSSLKNNPRRIVLISTTGVYGDSKGEWIDEKTPLKPQADRAIRRASAEQILQNWADESGCEIMILRVPGIYAEDRLPLARIEQGLPIVNADEAGFTNRIHADDLARACKAAMNCETHKHIINVTDGKPSTMTDYFNHVADFAKLPRPPQITMAEAEKVLSAGMVSYLKESRRIRNDKMLSILGIELLYPSIGSALISHSNKVE